MDGPVAEFLKLIGVALSSGAAVKFYEMWQAHRRGDQEYVNQQLRKLFEEEKQRCEEQRRRAHRLENSCSDWREKYEAAAVEVIRLQGELSRKQEGTDGACIP